LVNGEENYKGANEELVNYKRYRRQDSGGKRTCGRKKKWKLGPEMGIYR